LAIERLNAWRSKSLPKRIANVRRWNRAHRNYSTVKRCRGCKQEPQCTRGKFRTITIHTCEAARQKADEIAQTPEFALALRKGRKVEALFSELKNRIGLRRLRLRRIKFVREQFYLAAVAQNLKRLVRILNMRSQPAMTTAQETDYRKKNANRKKTPLRENASSNRVFQHQLPITLIRPSATTGAQVGAPDDPARTEQKRCEKQQIDCVSDCE
jgi:hypothetical protein